MTRRLVRSVLWFSIGCLLGGWFVFAHAADEVCKEDGYCYTGTVAQDLGPATNGYKGVSSAGEFYAPTAAQACQQANDAARGSLAWQYTFSSWFNNLCYFKYVFGGTTEYLDRSSATQVQYCATGKLDAGRCYSRVCPSDGKNWTKFDETQCQRPMDACQLFPGDANTPRDKPSNCQCPSGTTWVPMNGCRKTCGSWKNGDDVPGISVGIPKGESTACAGGCEVQHKVGEYLESKGTIWAPGVYTGWACSTTGPEPPPSPELDPKKVHKPLCGDGEGVMTSSSGTVACVPQGTPDTNKPVVNKQNNTQTAPDGSQKINTTTTTTDPGTGAKDIQVTVTITPASNGQPGQSGTPGTTTSSSSSSGNSSGSGGGNGSGDGQCAKEPQSSICRSSTIGAKGKFSDNGDKKTEAEKALTDEFNRNVEAMKQSFGKLTTGGGSLPCPPSVTVLGRSFSVCVSPYSSQLSLIGYAVMFMAAVASAFIILRR